jgi:hypothetical protein
MRGATPPLPQYVFTAWYLVKYRDNFTFGAADDSGRVKTGSSYSHSTPVLASTKPKRFLVKS